MKSPLEQLQSLWTSTLELCIKDGHTIERSVQHANYAVREYAKAFDIDYKPKE